MENQKKHEINMGTLYDLNKQAVLQLPKLTKKDYNRIQPELEEWFNWINDNYAMLLCRERYDFTIFHMYENQNPNPPAIAASELLDLLKSRGKVLSIEKDNNNPDAWEIWIKIGDEAFAYYLFNCDDFVIEC